KESSESLSGTWRSLLQDTASLGDLRLITIAESVADNLVRGVWKHPNVVRLHEQYNPQQIREDLHTRLSSEERAVFVADQVTADEVREGLALELVDLADGNEEAVPAYPLGIAAQTIGGDALSTIFKRVIEEELFQVHVVQVADLYANYLVRALS